MVSCPESEQLQQAHVHMHASRAPTAKILSAEASSGLLRSLTQLSTMQLTATRTRRRVRVRGARGRGDRRAWPYAMLHPPSLERILDPVLILDLKLSF